MRDFALGFLFCYLIGATPMAIIMTKLDKSPAQVVSTAIVWPNVMMRVALSSFYETGR
jgi:hypothetical protein